MLKAKGRRFLNSPSASLPNKVPEPRFQSNCHQTECSYKRNGILFLFFFFQHLNDCLLFLVGLESRCFYLTRRLLLFTIEEIMWSIVILLRLSKYLLVSNLPSNYSFVKLNFRLTGINVASEEGTFYIDPVLPQDDIPGVGSVGKHCEYKW